MLAVKLFVSWFLNRSQKTTLVSFMVMFILLTCGNCSWFY